MITRKGLAEKHGFAPHLLNDWVREGILLPAESASYEKGHRGVIAPYPDENDGRVRVIAWYRDFFSCVPGKTLGIKGIKHLLFLAGFYDEGIYKNELELIKKYCDFYIENNCKEEDINKAKTTVNNLDEITESCAESLISTKYINGMLKSLPSVISRVGVKIALKAAMRFSRRQLKIDMSNIDIINDDVVHKLSTLSYSDLKIIQGYTSVAINWLIQPELISNMNFGDSRLTSIIKDIWFDMLTDGKEFFSGLINTESAGLLPGIYVMFTSKYSLVSTPSTQILKDAKISDKDLTDEEDKEIGNLADKAEKALEASAVKACIPPDTHKLWQNILKNNP